MSVIVMGMDAPENCLLCDFGNEFGCCSIKKDKIGTCEWRKRPEWCPIRPLPEKHGGLEIEGVEYVAVEK